jgi:hypothetical protein
MFIDGIDDAITDGTWQTADNYRPDLNDHIEITIDLK